MKYSTICFILLTAIFSACSSIKNGVPTISQGIFGQLTWIEGNQMPSIGTAPKGNTGPVSRTIRIYELTKSTGVEGQSPLFDSVKTKLVATVKADKNGYFQYQLAPGKYSIFTVEENGKLFASLGDGEGNIAPLEVKENEVTRYDISINYRAAY